MKDGFYAHISADGSLNISIVLDGILEECPPENLADFLFSFIQFNFAPYKAVVDGLLELDIFAESLDVSYEDFDECGEYCGMIANGLMDFAGRYFATTELDCIAKTPDDGTASFWLYQARRMVDALADSVHAHTLISHAFHFLFAENGSRMDKLNRFFTWYPALREHLFEEAFFFEGEVLHRRKHIRSHTELMLFCLLELLEQETNILRCKCCGGYFVPKTKKMTLYCDRVIKDGKTCKEIAPALKRKQDKTRDAALAEYDRLYDLYYARMERYEGRTDVNRAATENDVTQDEFFIWSAMARELRKQYVAGEVGAEEFLAGLKMV